MNLNAIPVFGWILSGVFAISASIPFWLFWTWCELGRTYFYFLPERYQAIPFWHCVGLFIVVSILKAVLIPSLAEVSNTNKNEK